MMDADGNSLGSEGLVLKLFVSGASPNSVKAINNLQVILETHFKDQYQLSIVDIYQDKFIAKEEQIIALPMLVRKVPLPEKRLIGDMSDTVRVLKYLEFSKE